MKRDAVAVNRRPRVKALWQSPPSPIQVLGRAIDVLECFTTAEPELGVTTVARKVRLTNSTASRILASLANGKLLQRDGARGSYRLGIKMLEFARVVLDTTDLRKVAAPYLAALAVDCEETATLLVLDGREVVNLERAMGRRSIASTGQIGQRRPAHCTAAGKAMLANQPEESLATFLAKPLRGLTSRTITEPAAFRAELQQVKARGYGVVIEELEVGHCAVAAPVRDHSGAVVAAVSVAGPAFRFPPATIERDGILVRQAADQISTALGYRPHALDGA